jgi:small subunit ribosomal protein S19e
VLTKLAVLLPQGKKQEKLQNKQKQDLNNIPSRDVKDIPVHCCPRGTQEIQNISRCTGSYKMATIYNIDPSDLIEKTSEELKKVEKIKPPEWSSFVKTGIHKERPPLKDDWWYMRSASILRQVYRLGPIGVSKLRTKYGGKKNRGFKREHFYKGSGSIIRKVIQQLEEEGLVKTDLKSAHKGRVITTKGKKFLDEVAGKISKEPIKEAPKKEEAVKEAKPEVPKQEAKKVEQKTEQKPVEKPKETQPKTAQPQEQKPKEVPKPDNNN